MSTLTSWVELIFNAILGYVGLGEKFLKTKSNLIKNFLKPKPIMFTLPMFLIWSYHLKGQVGAIW